MATYDYDDFEITLIARVDGDFDLVAAAPDGRRDHTVFRIPLGAAELERAVLQMAKVRSRRAHAAGVGAEPSGSALREVAAAADEVSDKTDDVDEEAERLGTALGEALFGGSVGEAYDDARSASSDSSRGLRLTLSLGGAPALLSLPWEFLYRRPRFLASQRHTPLVRRLDTASTTTAPVITDTVHILGVISSPRDQTPLDVEAERRRVEAAVAKMVSVGRVQLDWLDPATPASLRAALRDNDYHILHYVGHSSFTDAGEGAIYLEGRDGAAVAIDNTKLANLLADQSRLRLVVLNSCEGARTTLGDPYAGVATTLIQLGVPAVVAMQFEISDRAAILFADELYTNLVGRQDPIGAAVAEARKAIYVELDGAEWATPVLFVRDPEVKLFDFTVPEADIEPARPPEPDEEVIVAPTTRSMLDRLIERGMRRWPLLVLAAVILGLGIWQLWPSPDPTPPTATVGPTLAPTTTTVSTVALLPDLSQRTAFAALQVEAGDGTGTHLYGVDADTRELGLISGKPGTFDTQAVWSLGSNRVAFTRALVVPGIGSGVFVATPGDDQSGATAVSALIPWRTGEFTHFPAWASNEMLWYVRTDDCEPGPECTETLRRADFVRTDVGPDRPEDLTYDATMDEVMHTGLVDVAAIAADPSDADTVVVGDALGLWQVTAGRPAELFAPDVVPISLAYTSNGRYLVAIVDDGIRQRLLVYDRSLDLLSEPSLGRTGQFRSVAGESQRTVAALSTQPEGSTVVQFRIGNDGMVSPIGVSDRIDVVQAATLGVIDAMSV